MNFTEIIDIITTSRNPLKIFSLLSNSYSLIAQELNNFSESIGDKFSDDGYVGGILYSLGMSYKTPSTFYADENYKSLVKRFLAKEEFRNKKLPSRFCQGVFGRYQGDISEETLTKVDQEYAVYRERLTIDKRINALKRIKLEDRAPEVGKEIHALINQKMALKNKNATWITAEQYKKQTLFYKSLQESFQLIQMLSKNTFSFIYFPFLIDRLSENLSDGTYHKLAHVEYLMKFHFCPTYDEYVMIHSFFLQLYEARYRLARFRKYVGLAVVFLTIAFFLPVGVSFCIVLFAVYRVFKIFVFRTNIYNIPVATLLIFGAIFILALSATVFQGDFYKRTYYRYQPVFNHLMVGTPYDYFDWLADSLKSNLGEIGKPASLSPASYSECLGVDYLKGERCR